MVSFTRAEKEDALKHVVNNVFGYSDTQPLAKALAENGYKSIVDIFGLTDNAIIIHETLTTLRVLR